MIKQDDGFTGGFTLVEVMMAVSVIGILAVIGITQFTNFSSDAKNSATKSNLAILRNAISLMNGLERTRCQKLVSAFPAIVTLQANDITKTGGQCDIATLLDPLTGVPYTAAAYLILLPLPDRPFVQNSIPVNPWTHANATVTANTVTASHVTSSICDNMSVLPSTLATECGTAATALSGATTEAGWCYCDSTGQIWANSGNNNGLANGTGTESLF